MSFWALPGSDDSMGSPTSQGSALSLGLLLLMRDGKIFSICGEALSLGWI